MSCDGRSGGRSCAARRCLDSPAGQYNFLQGGNLELMPETSDTYTYGVILQPRFLPKLAMSIDYFDIEIEDTISTFGADNTLDACYFAGRRRRPAVASSAIRERLAVAAATATWSTSTPTSVRSRRRAGISALSYTGVELGRFGELSFNLVGTIPG